VCLRCAAIDSDYFAWPSPWNAQRTFYQHRETEFNGTTTNASVRWLFAAREPHTRIKNILQHKRAQGADELLVRRKQPNGWACSVIILYATGNYIIGLSIACVREARGYCMCVSSVSAKKLRQSQGMIRAIAFCPNEH
jgi:hypothetical protein